MRPLQSFLLKPTSKTAWHIQQNPALTGSLLRNSHKMMKWKKLMKIIFKQQKLHMFKQFLISPPFCWDVFKLPWHFRSTFRVKEHPLQTTSGSGACSSTLRGVSKSKWFGFFATSIMFWSSWSFKFFFSRLMSSPTLGMHSLEISPRCNT